MTRKFVFSFLFLLFATPLIIAWYGVSHGRGPGMQVNRGYLFRPALALGEMPWKNIDGTPFLWKNTGQRWAMVYVVPRQCDAACHETLYKLHQVQIALNQDQDRFVRILVFLSPPHVGEMQKIHQDANTTGMIWLTLSQAAWSMQLEAYPYKSQVIREGGVFVLDPAQWAVLAYPATLNPQDLLKDLQRLMRAFHLGQSKA